MNFTDFKEIMFNKIKESFPEYDLKLRDVSKNNNITLTGIDFMKPDIKYGPCVYMETLYGIYNQEKSFEKLIEHIRNGINQNFQFNEYLSILSDFDKCKDLIKLRLINKKLNEERLKTTPYIPFMDLAIVCYVDLKDGTVQINNDFIDRLGIEQEELFEIAKENMKKEKYQLFDAISLKGYTLPSKEGFNDFLAENKNKLKDKSMLGGTNLSCVYGSNIILNDDYLELVSKIFDDSFYIIPISVHDCLFIKKSITGCSEDLRNMLIAGNRNEMITSKNDVLSDRIYFYDNRLGILSLV